MRFTEKELAEYQQRTMTAIKSAVAPKQSKYRNQKVTIDGITFDSKKELSRWNQLKMMESASKITELERQVKFELAPSVVIEGRKRPPMRYTADFTYKANGILVVEDCKSAGTASETAFKMRRHLMKSVHNIDIVIS